MFSQLAVSSRPIFCQPFAAFYISKLECLLFGIIYSQALQGRSGAFCPGDSPHIEVGSGRTRVETLGLGLFRALVNSYSGLLRAPNVKYWA
jgi:hypothetical protein